MSWLPYDCLEFGKGGLRLCRLLAFRVFCFLDACYDRTPHIRSTLPRKVTIRADQTTCLLFAELRHKNQGHSGLGFHQGPRDWQAFGPKHIKPQSPQSSTKLSSVAEEALSCTNRLSTPNPSSKTCKLLQSPPKPPPLNEHAKPPGPHIHGLSHPMNQNMLKKDSFFKKDPRYTCSIRPEPPQTWKKWLNPQPSSTLNPTPQSPKPQTPNPKPQSSPP